MGAVHDGDLGDRLRLAGEHLDHALLAVRMARPDRPRDAAKRALEAARTVIERASIDVARREAVADTPAPAEDIDMERRVLLKALMGASLVPMGALDALDRIRGGRTRQPRIDESLIWALRSLLGAYSNAYETMDAAALAPSAAVLVDRVIERLDEPMTPDQRTELGRIASESAALAGWLAHMRDHQGRARAYFLLARDTARDVGDETLHALALASLAQLCSSTPAGGHEGSPEALRLLQEADARLPDDAPGVARTMVCARLAEESAAVGDSEAYRQCMTRAEDAWTLARAGDGRRDFFTQQGFFAAWEDGAFDGYHAICLILLREPYAAEQYLSRAAARTLGQWRPRATLLTDLTAAYALQGEPEQACDTARGSLAASVQAKFPMGVHRLRGARRYLDRWERHPEVRDLDERLAAAA